ncbi:arf-GAP with dual PH domain-containing protein 2-like [Xenia sp. Carnegie-2017]|uniref:arf-GAP with dual PH domain-containing protein 2-like n=2 Tax=Xenia sp. Carnegie-2017 TaxID=2897299 RepID=UPI001F036C9D|nr:arf-GAP with dual PH domain-containing protein 2-like [Xenia sp. Carnegie-2017]
MNVVKAGFLEKLSGGLKREWKKRYFVLYQDGHLVYYDKPGSEHCKVAFNVKSRKRIDYGNEIKKNLQHKSPDRVQCMFYIRSSVKNFCLRAENEEEAREWVQELNKIPQMPITFSKRRGSSSRSGFHTGHAGGFFGGLFGGFSGGYGGGGGFNDCCDFD